MLGVREVQQSWSETSRALGSQVSQLDSALLHTRSSTPRGGGFWNSVLTAECRPGHAERIIQGTRRHFNSLKTPFAVYTFDGDFHLEFEKVAGSQGLLRSNQQTIMLVSERLGPGFPRNVERIVGSGVSEWCEVMGAIFERAGRLLKDMTECYVSAAKNETENTSFYVARDGRQMVGIAFCYQKAGIAGVHNVGVLSNYRNRGLGSALVIAAVHDALDRGASAIWLRTVTGEYPEKLYSALGFQTLTHCYAFRPKGPL